MITSLLLSFTVQVSQPYHVSGERVNRVVPRPIRMAFTPDPKLILIIAKDNELRWIDPTVKGSVPVRTAKLTEYPTFDFTGKQAFQVENARKLTEAMFGTSDPHPLQGVSIMKVKGDKEFCLTNRLTQFFFYSTETGELKRKVFLKMGKVEYHPFHTELSTDGKMVMVGDTALRTQTVYSLDTGEKIMSVPCGFMDTVAFMPDNQRMVQLVGNKLSFYGIKSKKPEGTPITLQGEMCGSILVNPDGKSVAYSTYAKKTGQRAGNFIYEFETKKSTRIEPKLDGFPTSWYSEDGTILMLHEPKWIHFVDAKTGAHKFTYSASFPDVWDRIWPGDLSLSSDNSRLLVMPDPALNDVNYMVFVDLKQPKGRPVTKVGPS